MTATQELRIRGRCAACGQSRARRWLWVGSRPPNQHSGTADPEPTLLTALRITPSPVTTPRTQNPARVPDHHDDRTGRRPTSATCCTSTPTGRRVRRQPSGTAHVFYPEATERALHGRAAARGRPGRAGPRARGGAAHDFALGAVRQRPPVRRLVPARGRARRGLQHRPGRPLRRRPELVDAPLPLEIAVPVLPVPAAAPDLVRELFEPLGWRSRRPAVPLDERFPEWGDSPLRRPRRLTRPDAGWPTR